METPQINSNPQPAKGWFSRNWIWAIPSGCGGCIVVIAGIAFVIFGFVFGALKSSPVYQQAIEKAKTDQAVVEALGEPVESSWFLTGSFSVTGSSGHADLSIPISGPKGKGTLFVVARKRAGAWIYRRLEVELERGGRIDLLD